MAHELYTNDAGKTAMAYVGEVPWHGLGQGLTVDADLDTWKREAGMDWDIKSAPVMYETPNGTKMADGRVVLYRSDNDQHLSIMTDAYKIVQPGEVIDFFSSLIKDAGMTMETAGVLFGGKRFWALANTGKADEVLANDKIKGYVLLTTSCDGTLATTAQLTTVRVVCNNTLTMSLGGAGVKAVSRTTHRSDFNAEAVKEQLGLVDIRWQQFINGMRALANVKVTDEYANNVFTELLAPKKMKEDGAINAAVQKKVSTLLELYKNGTGAEMHNGSAWGLLNAVTEFVDHGSQRRTTEGRFINSMLGGVGDTLKNKVYSRLMTELAPEYV